MPNYTVTVTGGVFDVKADNEDDAREQALEMVELEIVQDDDEEEE